MYIDSDNCSALSRTSLLLQNMLCGRNLFEKCGHKTNVKTIISHQCAILLTCCLELVFTACTEAGVALDLLESLARHLAGLDVATQRSVAAVKYNLLSTKVDPKDKKLVCELALKALENGTCLSKLSVPRHIC